MLKLLTIENFILINYLNVELEAGLCVLTGETGAGKSIILDALGLVLGSKSNTTYLKDKEKPAVLTAEFEINLGRQLEAAKVLEELGAASTQLIIRRVINCDGRGRAFINGSLINITQLERLGSTLVEVCGQHNHHQLLNPKNHLKILDEFALENSELANLGSHFDKMQQAKLQLEEAIALQEKAEEEKSYLEYVATEIEGFAPGEAEEEQLTEKRQLLSAKTKIQETAEEALHKLQQDQFGIMLQLYSIDKMLSKVPEQFQEAASLLETATTALEELKGCLQDQLKSLEIEEDLDQIEKRLFDLKNLARKYRVFPNQLSDFLHQTKNKLEALRDISGTVKERQEALQAAKDEYLKIAKGVSQERRAAASRLKDLIIGECRDISLEKADFEISLEPLPAGQMRREGIDSASFRLRTNPDSPFGPLDKIASGGELSRVMLAYKLSLSNASTQSTIIFDEIDTGISGRVAANIGKKLSEFAVNRQVLIVTHQPQVAAYSSHHYLVHKKNESGQTSVTVTKLSTEEKELEIARMLSGDKVTKEAIAAARRLLAHE